LQASSSVDHVAGDEPFARVGSGVDADERLAGVYREPDVHPILLQRPVANGQCRAHRALRIVFMDERRSEHGDDRIADELLHSASMTLELRPDTCVVRRELFANVFGIQPLRASRRPDKITEHDCDDLPFLDRRRAVTEPRSAR